MFLRFIVKVLFLWVLYSVCAQGSVYTRFFDLWSWNIICQTNSLAFPFYPSIFLSLISNFFSNFMCFYYLFLVFWWYLSINLVISGSNIYISLVLISIYLTVSDSDIYLSNYLWFWYLFITHLRFWYLCI